MDEENILAGLRAFNATKEQLEEARAALERRRRTQVFEVWPENWRAWELFQAMSNSWDLLFIPGGLGDGKVVYIGLKWPTLDSIERRLPPDPQSDPEDQPDPRTLFYQLRSLERETIEARN